MDYKAAERLSLEMPERRANGSEHHEDAEPSLSEPEPVTRG
jgi:hypothetical protein